MSDRFLFWAPTLIWATTWHAILYQLGEVSVLHSIGIRFGLASLLLFAIAAWRGDVIRQPLALHGWLILTGVVQYGFNYLGTYQAEKHLASGLLAVLFSYIVKYQYHTGYRASLVHQRSGTILNLIHRTVTGYERRVLCQPDDVTVFKHILHKIGGVFLTERVNGVINFI